MTGEQAQAVNPLVGHGSADSSTLARCERRAGQHGETLARLAALRLSAGSVVGCGPRLHEHRQVLDAASRYRYPSRNDDEVRPRLLMKQSRYQPGARKAGRPRALLCVSQAVACVG